MVDDLPEQWEISAHVAMIIQLANIAVILYSAIPSRFKTNRFIIRTTYLILFISWLSMVGMSMSWDSTVKIRGKPHSLYLFITAFGTAMADCMTSMVFWNIASWYPTPYISMMAAGEASSGIIASILIWIQQLNTKQPRFSVEAYLVLLSLILPISAIALYFLLRCRYMLNQPSNSQFKQSNEAPSAEFSINSSDRREPLLNVVDPLNHTDPVPIEHQQNQNGNLAQSYLKYLIILGTLSGVQNGMLPSINTYAMLPVEFIDLLLNWSTFTHFQSERFSNIPSTVPLFIQTTGCNMCMYSMAIQRMSHQIQSQAAFLPSWLRHHHFSTISWSTTGLSVSQR